MMTKGDARDVNQLLRFLIDEQAAGSGSLHAAARNLADRVQATLGEGVTREDLNGFLGHFDHRFGPLVAPHLSVEEA